MYLNTRRRQLSTPARIALGLALIALVFGLLVIGFAGPSSATETPHATTTSAPHGEEDDGCDHGATGKPCKDDPEPDHGKDCDEHGNHGGVNEDHCDSSGTPTTGTPTTGTPTTGTPTTGTPTGTTTPNTPPTTSTGTHTKNPVTPSTTRHTIRPTGGVKAPVKVTPRRTHATTTPPVAAPVPVVDQPELPRTGPISPEALWLGVLALLGGTAAYLLMPRTRRH